MKPYGLDKYGMRGCCPGHDEFPRETYNSRRSKKRHRLDTKKKRREFRRKQRQKLREQIINENA
jgi:hypothetical protein